MDIQEFQDKLSRLVALAVQQKNSLTQEQMREYFAGDDLDREQMLKILQYLRSRGIVIGSGEESAEVADDSIEMDADVPGTPAELTEEDKEYLRLLLADLKDSEMDERALGETFGRLKAGDEEALLALTQHFMIRTAEIAAEMNCEEMLLSDLIQEGNLALFSALSALREMAGSEDEADLSSGLENRVTDDIKKGLREAILAQTVQKQQDDSLVARVEKLDSAVRDLSEDEEDKSLPFTLKELAIILDMDEEEIRGILRLTGEDS